MNKLIKKALRIKGHKFYFSSENLDGGYYLPHCVKIKTKKRLVDLMKMNMFVGDIKAVSSDYANNLTVIYRSRK